MIDRIKSIKNLSCFKMKFLFLIGISLTLLLPLSSNAANMEDYCAIPPYAVSSGAVPNIMIAYEKGVFAVMKRAYSPSYDPTFTYYGYFDSAANYDFTIGAQKKFSYFEKSALCTPSAANLECISGNILNWALMSSLDLSRKALVGFGWPEPGVGASAGEVFTYTGDFAGTIPDKTPRSVGQWDDDDEAMPYQLNLTQNFGGSDYTYSFCLWEATGSNPTGLKINVRSGILPSDECPSNCNSDVLCIGDGSVTVKFADEDNRAGIIQRYVDTNQDLLYDSDAARFGVRRYTTAKDKNLDIFCDDATPPAGCDSNCTSDDITPLFGALLTTISKAPPAETTTAYLADMTVRITEYFEEDPSSAHIDNNAYTQTPYSWCDDTIGPCRKTFIIFITTGAESGTTVFSPLHDDCTPEEEIGKEAYFAQDICHAYKTDLSTETSGLQNIETYVVHTSFYGTQSCTQDSDCPGGGWDPQWNKCISGRCDSGEALQYAVSQGGGKYYDIDNPSKFEEILEEAVLSILNRVTSGTAASMLASSEGKGANIAQAIFYPVTPELPYGIFDKQINWIGRLANYWYYLDPGFVNSHIREDTTQEAPNRKLNLVNDYIATLYFDSGENQTKAQRCQDTDGDGDCDNTQVPVKIEYLEPIWEAGKVLWNRDISTDSRKIYTPLNTSLPLTNAANKLDAVNVDALRPLLNTDDALRDATQNRAVATNLIDYIHGVEVSTYSDASGAPDISYRSRMIAIDLDNSGEINVPVNPAELPKVWKLGDIVNSTPKISSWIPLNTYDIEYSDTTYEDYFNTTGGSTGYKERGMAFAGGNDGMLHAFKLGKLEFPSNPDACTFGGDDEACLSGTDLGKEMWAFIPKNVLPYLKYIPDPDYCHVYTVDLSPYLFDASINGNPEDTRTVNSWRTILIGGMRTGGACRDTASPCTDCVKTPVSGNGYSSYFALDITDQSSPVLLWEFSHEELGFSTTGPTIARISTKDISGAPENDTNGEWFVALISGSTGPIDTTDHQFMGRSDQNLKVFVLDLRDGSLKTTIGTFSGSSIPNAFGGFALDVTIDPDLNYQDDALYIPYTNSTAGAGDTYTDGGIIRILTDENTNPSTWKASKVMEGIGTVTSSVARLENTVAGKLWLFFGTGRYFYKKASIIDDAATQRKIFGIKEPCFSAGAFNPACTDKVNLIDLLDVTNDAAAAEDAEGWFISLDTENSPDAGFGAERAITDPIASTSGVAYFTTFKPSTDVCGFGGGRSHLWGVKYNTGGDASGLLRGKALIQVSTGSIEEIDLKTAFEQDADTNPDSKLGRRTGAMSGKPPEGPGLILLTVPPPVEDIIHMRER